MLTPVPPIGAGKLQHHQLVVISQPGSDTSRRLFYITDKATGARFLMDTGAEVSILPSFHKSKGQPLSIQLQVVNHSPNNTNGERSLMLDLGLRRVF